MKSILTINSKDNLVDLCRDAGVTFDSLMKDINDTKIRMMKNHKDKSIDNFVARTRFPFFNVTFYNKLIEDGHLFNQQEYFDYYMDLHKDYDVKINKKIQKRFDLNKKEKLKDLPETIKKALKIRLTKRVYPSMVRDIHFNLMLDAYSFYTVNFSLHNDSIVGVDSVVDNTYGIHLYLVTSRSLKYRDKKINYRHDYDDNGFVNIELPISLYTKKQNNFILYTSEHIDAMVDAINQHKSEIDKSEINKSEINKSEKAS